MEFRNLRKEELNSWYEFCGRIFNVPWEYFKRHYDSDPFKDISGIFIAMDHEEMVGSVRVFEKPIYCKGEIYISGGIGEVCTKKEYRGQGVSTTLLKRALEYMTTQGYDFSTLASGADMLYKKFGYVNYPLYYKEVQIIPVDSRYTFVNFNESYLQKMHDLYHDYSCHFIGPVARTMAYFESWFTSELSDKLIKIIEIDHEFIGYFIIQDHQLIEYIVKEGHHFDDIIGGYFKTPGPLSIPQHISTGMPILKETQDNHWMYKSLVSSVPDDMATRHLFFSIDNF